jgi:hypothetical protein
MGNCRNARHLDPIKDRAQVANLWQPGRCLQRHIRDGLHKDTLEFDTASGREELRVAVAANGFKPFSFQS